ncbi:MAG: hypothetical protein HKN26_15955 [Acidimicrobiales bacterium]|nr:hypothetical protein [Acidimicrobiales bacterium]
MQRTIVTVSKMRICDLAIGDVMNRDPDSMTGWFTIHEIRRLHNGDLNISSGSSGRGITGQDFDIVGVQVPMLIEQAGDHPPVDGLGAVNAA